MCPKPGRIIRGTRSKLAITAEILN